MQTIGESLITTTRETTNSTMVGIVDGTIVALHVWHQIIDQVHTEHILTKHCLWHAAILRLGRQQFVGITIGHNDNHFLCSAFSNKVIEDIISTTYFIIYLFGIGGSTNQVEHRIFLPSILLIPRWQIDDGLIRGT